MLYNLAHLKDTKTRQQSDTSCFYPFVSRALGCRKDGEPAIELRARIIGEKMCYIVQCTSLLNCCRGAWTSIVGKQHLKRHEQKLICCRTNNNDVPPWHGGLRQSIAWKSRRMRNRVLEKVHVGVTSLFVFARWLVWLFRAPTLFDVLEMCWRWFVSGFLYVQWYMVEYQKEHGMWLRKNNGSMTIYIQR